MKKKWCSVILAAVMAVSALPCRSWAVAAEEADVFEAEAEKDESEDAGAELDADVSADFSSDQLDVAAEDNEDVFSDDAETAVIFDDAETVGDVEAAEDVTVEGDYEYEVNRDGKTISITKYNGEGGSVTIPSTLGDYSVTSIGEGTFKDCSNLTNVIIPDSVTIIGKYAFYGCSSLTSVTIPNSVSTIYNYAFCNCSSLTSVTIPDRVTWIGGWAFSGCSSLTSVAISKNLRYIINFMFYGCSSLTSIAIPDSVTGIETGAFEGCSSLASVIIPDSVTSIGDDAFEDCNSLTNVTIPGSVTSIGFNAFYNCSGLTSVTIPNGVTSIEDNTFYRCSSLTSVTIPDSVTSIGSGAFEDCSSLTKVTIPDSVTSIDMRAFYGCRSLVSVTISNSITSISAATFSGCSNLTSVTIPDRVTSIRVNAFYGCSSLTSVTIPDSVTSIGEEVFYGCSSLTSVTIPNSVSTISNYAFGRCSSLTSVIISNNVTSINAGMFSGCSNLTSVTIPNSVTSIGNYVFKDCSSLTSVVIPDSVTSIGKEVFYGCSSLMNVTISNSVTSINDGTFQGCSNLTSVIIPDSVTSIGVHAFSGCSNLTDVTIPDSVVFIGNYAFYGCSSLTSVTIPNSVTTIGTYAFGYCTRGWAGSYKLDGFVIYGSTGSVAETYTKENDITFKALDDSSQKSFSMTLSGFNSSSEGYAIIGKSNSLAIHYTSAESGKFAEETEKMTFTSSDSSVADVEYTAERTDISGDDTTGTVKANLVTHKPGTVTVTATSEDGRTASLTVTVVPEITVPSGITLTEKKEVEICSVKLTEPDAEYLQTYISNLQVGFEFAVVNCVNFLGQRVEVSEDGLSAKLLYSLAPLTKGLIDYTVTSEEGQKVTGKIETSYATEVSDGVAVTFADYGFWDEMKSQSLRWSSGSYNHDEFKLKVAVSGMASVREIQVTLQDLKMFKVKDSDSKTNEGSTYTYTINVDQAISGTTYFDITLVKNGLTWWKPSDAVSHTGIINVTAIGTNADGSENVSAETDYSKVKIIYENKDKAVEVEEEASQEIEHNTDEIAQETADDFTDLSDKISLDSNIETYIGHNQYEALKMLIYTEVSLANISKSYFTSAGLSDKVAEKIMSKYLGYESPKLGLASKEVPIEVVVAGLDNKQYQFRFDCNISVYSVSGSEFGLLGDIQTQMWEVSAPNQKINKIPCTPGEFSKADTEAFCRGVWSVAESSLKTAYNKIWGSDANKLANGIVEDSIDSIASKAAKYGLEKPVQTVLKKYYEDKLKGKFSEKLFKLLIYPSKLAVAQCPVDIYVYNSQNTLVGSIVDNQVSMYTDEGIALWTVGDDKYVQLFDESYRVEYKASGTGTMDLTVYDQTCNDVNYRKCDFSLVPLQEGITYTQTINNELLTEVGNYMLSSNQETEIPADSVELLNAETIEIPADTPSVTPTVTPVPTAAPSEPAVSTVTPAPASVQKEQKITASSVTKKYSKKAQKFNLNVKRLGGAKMTYKSSSKYVKVSASGKVTIVKKFIGKAAITIKASATSEYKAGSKKITVTVIPSTSKITKISAGAKKFAVKWKKDSAVTGYQVQYSTSAKFSSAKTKNVAKKSITGKTVTGLKKKTTYYVRVRSYKKTSTGKIYSRWSSVKKIRTK